MKKLFILLLLALNGSSMALAGDGSNSRYVCAIFEPNMNMLEVRVNPENSLYTHRLADQVHLLEVQWWDWTLNLSLQQKDQDVEILGAASSKEVKLRSGSPDISVHCRLE